MVLHPHSLSPALPPAGDLECVRKQVMVENKQASYNPLLSASASASRLINLLSDTLLAGRNEPFPWLLLLVFTTAVKMLRHCNRAYSEHFSPLYSG